MVVSDQLHDPAALLPGKGSPVPFGYVAGWLSGRGGEEKNKIPTPAGNRIPVFQAIA